MEALHFIARYPEINAIYFSTIDPEAIQPYFSKVYVNTSNIYEYG